MKQFRECSYPQNFKRAWIDHSEITNLFHFLACSVPQRPVSIFPFTISPHLKKKKKTYIHKPNQSCLPVCFSSQGEASPLPDHYLLFHSSEDLSMPAQEDYYTIDFRARLRKTQRSRVFFSGYGIVPWV